MQSCLQKYNKLNKSHLVGQLLNSILEARTHVYKKSSGCSVTYFFFEIMPFIEQYGKNAVEPDRPQMTI